MTIVVDLLGSQGWGISVKETKDIFLHDPVQGGACLTGV
jgi:hypothetical protein